MAVGCAVVLISVHSPTVSFLSLAYGQVSWSRPLPIAPVLVVQPQHDWPALVGAFLPDELRASVLLLDAVPASVGPHVAPENFN